MTTARYWVLGKRVKEFPKLGDFFMVKEYLRDIVDGEILLEAEYISVDPFIREVLMPTLPIGGDMPGCQLARVIESKDKEFELGSLVVAYLGWRDISLVNPSQLPRSVLAISELPELKDLPETYALGPLGMPGLTAYYGMIECCKPVGGDTCVVSSAGGAVGSIAAQIARIKGCRVIAVAGSDKKIEWLERDLNFPGLINYKQVINMTAAIKEKAPEGIDCFFDTVGGEFAYHVMKNMNSYGRIAQVGALSKLRLDDDLPTHQFEPIDYVNFRGKQLRIEGFSPARWYDREQAAINQIRTWILQKRIFVEETFTKGFENCPQAFLDMMNGKNVGKQIVQIVK